MLCLPYPKKHSSCKGKAHGSGNYGCVEEKECELDKSPFQRNNSKRWSGKGRQTPRKYSENSIDTESVKSVDTNKSAFQRNGSVRGSLKSETKNTEKKPTSVSSDNFSESDSLDSLGEKKTSDNTEDANKKESAVSNRLYNGVTRSSIAKTARMRHLDIFDVDDNIWMGGLRKNNTPDEADKKLKQKLLNEFENAFDRSKNGSFKRRNSSHSVDSNDVKSTKEEIGSVKSKGIPPKVPPRNSLKRRSFRSPKLLKIKQICYDDVLFMSTNKKTLGYFYIVDKNECFKDFKEILANEDNQVGILLNNLYKILL